MAKSSHKRIYPKRCTVFFDFDNTITIGDVIDDMLVCFSRDGRWKKLEDDWRRGKIGSRACLKGQIEGMYLTKGGLDSYLSGVKLDPSFKKLLELLERKNIKPVVLSDNFAYILKKILAGHSLSGRLRVYANGLRFSAGRLFAEFPFSGNGCRACAHCKKRNLLANAGKNSIIIYIGDGRSDICPSRYAHIVFAKKELSELCKKENLAHIPYKNLKEVYGRLKEMLA